MPGPKPNPPIFDREQALKFRQRYLMGERYEDMAKELDVSTSRFSHCMRKHGVISKKDTSDHYAARMAMRNEKGIRVGRKPLPRKKK